MKHKYFFMQKPSIVITTSNLSTIIQIYMSLGSPEKDIDK